MVGGLAARLQEAVGSHRFRFTSDERATLEETLKLSTEDLLRGLVVYAQAYARVPISDFRVGASALTHSGEIFLGVNLEFEGAAFHQTVHAEQFLVSWSRACSESPLRLLAVSAAPCGHCRQFLREADPEGDLTLFIQDGPAVISADLLPRAFTPKDLGVTERFHSNSLVVPEGTSVAEAARSAAEASYAPYSKARVGAAFRIPSGEVFAGSSIENAAYNPTLPAFQGALIAAHAHGVAVSELSEVVICQEVGGKADQSRQASTLAQALGLEADCFHVVEFNPDDA